MHETLAPALISAAGIFETAEVERLKREHLSGQRKHSKILFSLLMFQLWQRRYQGSLAGASVTPTVTFAA
jgi:asparagine synthase (glutamine-hydrolysing)